MPASNAIHQRALAVIERRSAPGESNSGYPVTINFHPDHLTRDGEPLLSAIGRDGRLKSQFETGTSNGGLTAYPGGERWFWEQRVFDHVYDDCEPGLRPKYGALDYRGTGTGGSPRFGSSHFRLKPQLQARSSFCYPDSYFEPDNFATYKHVEGLVQLARDDNQDLLDCYIEAHIHGELLLARDIEAIVLDPSYRGSAIEQQAKDLPVSLEWHPGFRLDLERMRQYPDYRGQQYIELAERIAPDGVLRPDLLGQAVRQGHDPQDVKKVWHYLARFGDLSAGRGEV